MFKINVKESSIKYVQNKSKLTKNEICEIKHEIQVLDSHRWPLEKQKSNLSKQKRRTKASLV